MKGNEGRTVPLAPQLATALAGRRPAGAADGDLVFPSALGRKLDGDALSTRYRKTRDAAGLRPLRFHDLRHTFGSLAVDGGASLVQVQSWMGHSAIQTTMRYLHTKSRAADAALLGRAFTIGAVEQVDARPTSVPTEAATALPAATRSRADTKGTARHDGRHDPDPGSTTGGAGVRYGRTRVCRGLSARR